MCVGHYVQKTLALDDKAAEFINKAPKDQMVLKTVLLFIEACENNEPMTLEDYTQEFEILGFASKKAKSLAEVARANRDTPREMPSLTKLAKKHVVQQFESNIFLSRLDE